MTMRPRRSSRLAERKEAPETSNKITLEDISSPSDPEWDNEGSDYGSGETIKIKGGRRQCLYRREECLFVSPFGSAAQ
jgi:hypothetical protein